MPQASCHVAAAGPCVTPYLSAMQACSHDALDRAISHFSNLQCQDCRTGRAAIVPKAVL